MDPLKSIFSSLIKASSLFFNEWKLVHYECISHAELVHTFDAVVHMNIAFVPDQKGIDNLMEA